MPSSDPWSQDFLDFKNHYKGNAVFPETPDNLGMPENAIFTAADLRMLLGMPNTTHVVFYPVRFQKQGEPLEQMMVAVALNASEVRSQGPPNYKWSIHNCPPNCRGVQSLFNKVNLTKPGSIE